MGTDRRAKRRQRLDPGARDRILAGVNAAGPDQDAPDSNLLREIILDLQTVDEKPEPAMKAPVDVAANWAGLEPIPIDPRVLDDNLIITAARTDPSHGAFDVLRTRMVQATEEHGWQRIGITSPTKGCGKTFTALNLAVTLSRYGGHRTVLLDLDLRVPAVAKTLGVQAPGAIGDMLLGRVPPLSHLRCFGANNLHIGDNVALGLNNRTEPYAAELFHSPQMEDALGQIDTVLAPDLMLFDLPPALAQDDVIALAPHFDCILMVVGGGITTQHEIRESLRRIGEEKPVLGMVLNKAESGAADAYRYAY